MTELGGYYMSQEELRELWLRRKKQSDIFSEMNIIFSGSYHSFMTYTHTASKEYSQTKTAEFINELMSYYEKSSKPDKAQYSEDYFYEAQEIYEQSYFYYEAYFFVVIFYLSSFYEGGYFTEEEDMIFETLSYLANGEEYIEDVGGDSAWCSLEDLIRCSDVETKIEKSDSKNYYRRYKEFMDDSFREGNSIMMSIYKNFPSDVKNIIELFLCGHGMSLYSNQKTFQKAMAVFQGTRRKLQAMALKQDEV